MRIKDLTRYSLVALALILPVSGSADENALFNKLDTDKNGFISKDELLKSDLVVTKKTQGQQQIIHRDLTKDGQSTTLTAEQKKHLFDQIDTDQNGFLNRKEWSRASKDGFILWKF